MFGCWKWKKMMGKGKLLIFSAVLTTKECALATQVYRFLTQHSLANVVWGVYKSVWRVCTLLSSKQVWLKSDYLYGFSCFLRALDLFLVNYAPYCQNNNFWTTKNLNDSGTIWGHCGKSLKFASKSCLQVRYSLRNNHT